MNWNIAAMPKHDAYLAKKNRVCYKKFALIESSFLKFGGMTPFLTLVVIMYKSISFHKPNKKYEEWEDDGPTYSSKGTPLTSGDG